MPNTYSISNLLEIKDLIVDDFISSSTDIHLYFHLEQRDVSCPFCNSITNKVHDYRTSVIKDAPIQGKFLLLHYKREDIIAITVIIISMSLLTYYPNIAV